MGIVIRQSIKASIVILAGSIIGALTNYFSAYVFDGDRQQFGFIRTLINVGTIIQFVLLLGAGPTLQVFLQRYATEDTKSRVLITVCSLIPLVFLLLLLPFYLWNQEFIIHLFQPRDQPYFRRYYLWLPALALFWSYMTLYECYMIARNKTAQALIVREVILRAFNIFILLLLFLKFISFNAFVLLTFASYVVSAFLLLGLSFRNRGFGYAFQWRLFTLPEYREIFRFSWYHWLMGLSLYMIGFLDALMLATMDKKGLFSVPVYTIAVFIATLILIPYRAMTNAVFPVFNKAYIDKDEHQFRDIFERSAVNFLVVAVAMVFLIGLNLPNAVRIFPKGYEAILPITWILMLGRMADMATGMNNEVISITSLYKFNFWISFLLVVFIMILGPLLIPTYGPVGAAWATTLSVTIFNIVKFIYIKRKMGLQPFSAKSPVILLAGLVAAAITYVIPYVGNPFADTFVRVLVSLSIYVVIVFRLRLSAELNAFLDNILKNRKLW